MKTVKDVFAHYYRQLMGLYDLKEIEAITLLVLNDLSSISKAKLKAFPETEIIHKHIIQLNHILSELKTGRPIQYILGYTEFYGLPFEVDPSVLIPRPETEELVHWVIDTINKSPCPIKTLLDIGTGSGCIAIILKKYFTDIEIYATDISTEALKMAKKNAELNQVTINFIEADILNFNYNLHIPDFDIIISNPPYITPADKQQMHANVTNFEPHTALFVPEDDPLLFYKAIAGFAKKRLTKNGRLFFEINESYGKETTALLHSRAFNKTELKQDMAGKDRMIKAEIS